ncbi:hypothetical protein SISSUDRAFT_650100 [Sistotremastrum suecicum HHB10207 ss-3]|uniref:Uncharacterized protein n=1 Tax=Sistotremastrum suecicum HHB10207 ss-3 TaxID=1314776 RepID=A0A165X5E2_9AGAM|nr:hypothetical protein SISSUDRAFT_650100 [Sistotremastrum suecicum HHB10207 ss-3]
MCSLANDSLLSIATLCSISPRFSPCDFQTLCVSSHPLVACITLRQPAKIPSISQDSTTANIKGQTVVAMTVKRDCDNIVKS